ncbi:hypothetical protein PENARI_c023G02987 [Penicillium arizonense]|uniref:Uncharacterized protein n=1 Tax=Penicillium arizonense TaxID=1835702 RepID=A0A1F5L7I8_PENAI|nr:hypothetical protein PENARI_c023G02987 [Penicillium arizonense]
MGLIATAKVIMRREYYG